LTGEPVGYPRRQAAAVHEPCERGAHADAL
jgi:hypothetical protein